MVVPVKHFLGNSISLAGSFLLELVAVNLKGAGTLFTQRDGAAKELNFMPAPANQAAQLGIFAGNTYRYRDPRVYG